MALFGAVDDFSVPDKLKELETFMDDVIQKKVGDAQDAEKRAYAQTLDVKNLIRKLDHLIEDETRELTCLTDIGGECFVTAHIPDVTKMCVELIQGFYMEMPLSPMREFLKKKLSVYEE